MPLRLFNTLSGKIEEFRPLVDNEVRMYACGPTVYDYGHIGNFRTFVAVDILRRYLRQSGHKLHHVMNITDVDDKIIRNAAQAGVNVQQYTAKYQKAFLEDAAALHIEEPQITRATEHIAQMAEFIARLVEKGLAYKTEDGSYYFRIAKFPGYGKLSKSDFAVYLGQACISLRVQTFGSLIIDDPVGLKRRTAVIDLHVSNRRDAFVRVIVIDLGCPN